MLKTVHTPNQLREFNSLFGLLARKQGASKVFDDFLTIFICCLARKTQEDLYFETIKDYTKEDLQTFAKMMAELFLIYGKSEFLKDWCDPLGEYYEELASNYKKSNFGQFFTPKGICDLMAQMTIKENDFGNTINDCASGSGRTLLAANKICKGNIYIAQDLDHVCVKMCAINMAMHGLKGEVLHMNSLQNNEPYNRYIINHDWHKTQTPFIYKI